MTRFAMVALCAAMTLGACASPDITSRLDTSETLFGRFETTDSYTPRPIAGRTDNDFMRFSTMGLPQ